MSDPNLSQLLQFRAAVDRLIQDTFEGADLPGRRPACAVDLVVEDDQMILSADLPGVQPDSVRVVIRGGTVTITGRRAPPAGAFVCAERAVGPIEREISLPACADGRQATATLRDGVLTLRLPRLVDRRGAEHLVPVRAL